MKGSKSAPILAALFLIITCAAAFILLRPSIMEMNSEQQAAKVAPSQNTEANRPTLLESEPYQPTCGFWKPWIDLVSPASPPEYLSQIISLLKDGSKRSEAYINIIMKDPGMLGALRGDSEDICISGYFDGNKNYMMDAETSTACNRRLSQFLDQQLEIKVKPLKTGGFYNHIRFRLHLGNVTADKFRKFWIAQMALIKNRYQGWTQAYPNFYAVNRSGFGLVDVIPTENGDVRAKFDWLTQSMVGHWPGWAIYLLKLGDILEGAIELENDQKQMIGAVGIDTRLSSVHIVFPPAVQNYSAGDHVVSAFLNHHALVRFRGLEINVRGFKFKGNFTSQEDTMAFDGVFDGVEKVDIGGSYRNLGNLGIGRMINDLVRETMQQEIGRLQRDSQGNPAHLRVGIFQDGEDSYLEADLTFEAAINFLNIIREEKDQVGGPVMPDPTSISDLNRWTRDTYNAILKDYEASHCKG